MRIQEGMRKTVSATFIALTIILCRPAFSQLTDTAGCNIDSVIVKINAPKSATLKQNEDRFIISEVSDGYKKSAQQVSFEISSSAADAHIVLTTGQGAVTFTPKDAAKKVYLLIYGGFKEMIAFKGIAIVDGNSVSLDALSTFPNNTIAITIPANTSEVRLSEFILLSKYKRPPDDSSKWPKSIDQAVSLMISTLSEEDKQMIKSTKKKDLIKYHQGLGTSIRNNYGLWKTNTDLLKDCGSAKIHPDDCSMKIIEALWEKLQEKQEK